MADALTQSHIMVVDDDRELRDLVGRYLREHGFRVSLAASGQDLRQQLPTLQLDLVVLDIMMPGEDGLSVCRYLREHTALPVIMLTAMGEDTDRIVGLEMGADDYLSKPFNPRELLARIRAVLRRVKALPPQSDHTSEDDDYHFEGWTLNTRQRTLLDPSGVEVALSTGEYRLLLVFLQHPRHVLSRDQLLELTQGRDAQPFDRSIDNQVSRLRRKIEVDPRNPQLIGTVWGGGYQWQGTVERSSEASA
ncbi:DNA-binding response regulator [Terasakiispira papahanaumokuakeensis]|uniref:DNA-binding response regulator n=1 Tax=Terasakiispira papahanaumokuakeensis TaxID=197479 RepID=A0A1E2VBQ0_9GAMM|nr:response regulator [Terasakiispira papahanaumokuakeensis]ODC04428.1 DNA-binding response regulator [Terasakiispira papahanaumokuakeensis]